AKFKGGKAPADSDRDSISDEWESAHGLDPNNAADGNLTTLSAEGYTNIELYLNELAGDSVQIQENPVVIEPLNGTLIQSLEIKDTANYKSWQIAENAAVGDAVFGDRDVTYTALPSVLQGAEFIRTACDSKNSGSDLAAFTAGADITAYLLVDSRVTATPAWRSGWTKTDLTAENNKGVTFAIYSKNYATGETVTLGANGQSTGCVNYTVFVTAQQGVIGDVNADGTFSTADIEMLQKWLLTDGTLTDWNTGDLDGNGKINAIDLTLMKRMALT
ncbi:MAG: dockerin type I repeat-containing protein, partial [Oscillospiraceae bacterium]|nr:dockerin type I repeat-containing protein [Oscillospiraceae bacterium]